MSPLTMAFAKMALRGLPQMPPLLGLCLGHQALGVAEAKIHHAWDLVSFWEKSWNMIGWDGILYIYMIEKYLTQPLSGIIYRPTYTYYHSHYHYHCHDQYHMMLISLSLSVSLSIYQNHDISHHFTLCRIISHHTKILYYTFTHINVYIYIYTHVIMFFWQFPPIYAQLVPPGCRRAGACPCDHVFFGNFPLFMHNLSHRAAAGLAPVQVGLGAVPWRHWGAPSSEKDGNLCQPTEGCSMDWFVQKCAETFSCIITLIYINIYIYICGGKNNDIL